MNKVILSGRLGSDPEIKTTSGGKSVVNVSLAVRRERDTKTVDWVRLVIWEKAAENVARFCRSGSRVLVDGRLQDREWEDQSGKKRKTTEVHTQQVEFLDSKSDKNPDTGAPDPQDKEKDDLPF